MMSLHPPSSTSVCLAMVHSSHHGVVSSVDHQLIDVMPFIEDKSLVCIAQTLTLHGTGIYTVH